MSKKQRTVIIDDGIRSKRQKLTKNEKKLVNQQKNKYWNNVVKTDVGLDANPRFSFYFRAQLPDIQTEWAQFRRILSLKLPVSFRYSPYRFPISSAALENFMMKEFNNVKGKYIEAYDGKPINNFIKQIKWHKNTCQLNDIDAGSLNQLPELKSLSDLLARECALGHIVKQELVSMLPAILLNLPNDNGDVHAVKSHHNILDVCASPGSKTDQLLSVLYNSLLREQVDIPIDERKSIPSGMVIANDADTKRIQTLRNRFSRYNNPNLLLTCSRAEDLAYHMPKHSFHHIVCDVPCSGDGTFRKSPHLWRNFRSRVGISMHTIQLQIALASIELLSMESNSRFVYSTCSINPMEDESVVCSILRQHGDTLRLVDLRTRVNNMTSDSDLSSTSDILKNLKWRDGISKWRTDVDIFVDEGDEDDTLPDDEVCNTNMDPFILNKKSQKLKEAEKLKSIKKLPEILPSMVAPSEHDAAKYHLDRCMRILHHDQDTGGFFIAVFERYNSVTELKSTIHCGLEGNAQQDKVLVSHNDEINVLKNLGYNPRHTNVNACKAGDDATVELEQHKALEKWRRETDVYTYTQISNNEWQQLVDIGGGRPDGGVKEPPMEQLFVSSSYPSVTVKAPCYQVDTTADAGTKPVNSSWSGLQFLSKFGLDEHKEEQTKAVVSVGADVLTNRALVFTSTSVAQVLNTWGKDANIVVQAGVNVAHYVVDDNSNGVNSELRKMRIQSANHCNATYVSQSLPQLVRSVLDVDMRSMIWLLLQAISPVPVSFTDAESNLEFVLSHTDFVSTGNSEERVFPSDVENLLHCMVKGLKDIESYSYIVQTKVTSGCNSGNIDSSDNLKSTGKIEQLPAQSRKIPKAERKRMKKLLQAPNLSCYKSGVGVSIDDDKLEYENSVSKRSCLDSYELFGIVVQLQKRKHVVKLVVETPSDICHSIYDILIHFLSMK